MSVKISLEFNSVEDAIVALGKLASIPAAAKPATPLLLVAPKPETAPQTQTGATPLPGPRKPRKPRADAGQPRGPYKDKEQNANTAVEAGTAGSTVGSGAVDTATAGKQADPGKAADQAANPTSTPPAVAPATQTSAPAPAAPAASAKPAESTPTAPAAAVPSLEDVQKAVEKLFAKVDFDGTRDLLARFGVKRGQEIRPDQRANFIARVDGVVERGEAI